MTDTKHPEALRLVEQYDYGDPVAHSNTWKTAVCNELRRLHDYCQELESQVIRDCMTHVQKPAGIEHVANDVSKNGAEVNVSTQQPAPASQQEAPAEELEEVLRERDDAEDFINELLDEFLGADRPEWSSAYNRYDAMNDVRERITALHKPAADKAWGRFESAMAAPQPSPTAQAADSVQEDAARYRLLRRGRHWSVIDGIGNDLLRAEALDAAVDAALAAQGGKV